MKKNKIDSKVVGFIGLGKMGSGMVQNLLRKGYQVIAYDSSSEALQNAVDNGVKAEKNIQDLALNADTIILCLPHPDITKELLFGSTGLLSVDCQNKTIIETSTLTPDIVIDIEKKLKGQGVSFLSALMFGGKDKASAGTIHFLVEGDENTFKLNEKLLLAMGARASYLGAPPRATITKIARNMCRYANEAVAIEAIRFLKHYTDDLQLIYDLITESSKTNFDGIWERVMKDYALTGKPHVPSNIALKDLGQDLLVAEAAGIDLPITKAVKAVQEDLVEK